MHILRFAVLGTALLFALPVTAQSLPDWAAPSAAPTPAESFQTPMEPLDATPSPPGVPIDGGLGLLALAGAGYAARKLRKPSAE
ncbi:MAG: hypothetical protein AAF809_06385 [Bacteroidota bacterium]